MQPKKSLVLGRGLEALFGQTTNDSNHLNNYGFQLIPIEQIIPDKHQPRRHFNEQDLAELAHSIADKGVLQPVLVRQKEENLYELIAGERRWRATLLAGKKFVPAIIKSLSNAEALEITLIENIQRQDLTPIEEATGYDRLMKEFSYTQDQLAYTLRKSRSHVANYLRLLNLPETVKGLLHQGKLSMGHARALINHPDAEKLAVQILQQNLNVRDVEKIKQKNKLIKTSSQEKISEINNLELQLSQLLNLEVKLKYREGKGDLKIKFDNIIQLDNLITCLNEASEKKVLTNEKSFI